MMRNSSHFAAPAFTDNLGLSLLEESRWWHAVVYICLYFFGFVVVDVALAIRTPARWFVLHILGNALIVAGSIGDVIYTIRNPISAVQGETWPHPLYVVSAMHAYHMLAFRNLTLVDIIHHVLMCGIAGPVALFFSPGPVVNYLLFFLSGLPGGADYVMLVLVKMGYIRSITEKRINAQINLYLRAPGILNGIFVLWANHMVHPNMFSPMQQAFGILCVGLLAWNAQYFCSRVVGNLAVRTFQLAGETKPSIADTLLPSSLPPVAVPSHRALVRTLASKSLEALEVHGNDPSDTSDEDDDVIALDEHLQGAAAQHAAAQAQLSLTCEGLGYPPCAAGSVLQSILRPATPSSAAGSAGRVGSSGPDAKGGGGLDRSGSLTSFGERLPSFTGRPIGRYVSQSSLRFADSPNVLRPGEVPSPKSVTGSFEARAAAPKDLSEGARAVRYVCCVLLRVFL